MGEVTFVAFVSAPRALLHIALLLQMLLKGFEAVDLVRHNVFAKFAISYRVTLMTLKVWLPDIGHDFDAFAFPLAWANPLVVLKRIEPLKHAKSALAEISLLFWTIL